ncbi:MAG TPA: ATP-dependent DNA helicase RecQ, partial [Treponema sp.]|nr:ATP-dependent DNA helicase RecQ [Treponema sp.]
MSGSEPERVLKEVFGYEEFRPLQREVIQNVLDGRDTLAVMPTGGGKSLCYQIPALIMEGLTIVVSPLIALMQDQVAQLEAAGVPAVFINSSLDIDAYRESCALIRSGEIRLLYVSPEGLSRERMQELLHSSRLPLRCITIDEAHCISEWGHDFRPDYMEIAAFRNEFKDAVCLALTATATKQVQADIVRNLKLKKPAVLVSSFNRSNIFLNVQPRTDGLGQIVEFLQEHKEQSGIIYCLSRKEVDSITQELQERGFSAMSYHAGLSDEERADHQNKFIKSQVDVIVATVAFGMGINKPDVRFVIHYALPKSIEEYYQEIGRAGRDGLP